MEPIISQARSSSAAPSIRQDRADDDVEEMIGARRELRLVTKPRKRPDQREQVNPINVGSRHSLGLSTEKELCACGTHRNA